MTKSRPKHDHILNKLKGITVVLLLAQAACSRDTTAPQYAASIEPAAMILRELVGERGEVRVLMQPGASPHAYEPKPSDARFAEDALATFYFAREVDGWAAKLGGDRAIAIASIQEPDASETQHDNPHMWLDPLAVRQCIPKLRDTLIQLDPGGASIYNSNAERFMEQLTQLHLETQSTLKNAKGLAVIQAHASWDLFFERYGIRVAGVLESTPGASLPPRQFAKLIDAVAAGEVFAIISEPQLPRTPLEILAANKVPIVELDPLGGGAENTTYEAFIRANANRLAEAIQ